MLVEGVFQYEVFHSEIEVSIIGIRPVKLGTPLTENSYILCDNQTKIFLNNGYIFTCKYEKIISGKSKILRLVRDKTLNEKINGLEYHFESFDSIYPCTDVFMENEKLISEFNQSKKTKEEILNEIQKINGELVQINETFYLKSTLNEIQKINGELVQINENFYLKEIMDFDSDNIYILKCKDCSIKVERNILKNNLKPSKYKNNTNFEIKKSTIDPFPKINLKSIVFEHFNRSDYSLLAREYLSELKLTKYSYYSHAILQNIEILYFTFLKTFNCVTIIISRKLFDFTLLFRYLILNPLKIENLLKIPDLDADCSKGKIEILINNENMLIKYSVPFFDYNEILILANKFSSIQIIENCSKIGKLNAFWFIQSVKEQLFPIKFPGLIALPLLNKMNYLLNGPYPSIFSMKSNPIFDSKLKISTVKIPLETSIRNNLYFKDYLNEIIKKKIFKGFQKPFESPFLLEKIYLNDSKTYKVHFSFDLTKSKINFIRSGRFNMKDSLSLWMLIFNGTIDLEKLFKNKNTDRGILIKRACIQKDQSMVNKILKKIKENRRTKYIKVKRKAIFEHARNNVRNKMIALEIRKPKDFKLSVLKEFTLDSNIFEIPKITETEVIIEKQTFKRFHSTFIYKGIKYKLLKLEDIFCCLSKSYYDDRILGSILAFLKYANLPLEQVENASVLDGNANFYLNFQNAINLY